MSIPASLSITADQATAFLSRDPIGSVELICALRYDRDIRCVGVLRDGELTGVLVATREEGGDGLTARFEAAETETLASLIAACPREVRRVVVHRPWMLPVLHAAFRLRPEQPSDTVFFARSVIPPPASPAVRLLTAADAPLMAASAAMGAGMGFLASLAHGFRPFGIVLGDRIVAHACAANGTEWTEEVMSVWTAPRRRGQGLATAVVTATAADILSRGKTAIYVAAVTNRASLRVAAKAGFQPAYETMIYRVMR